MDRVAPASMTISAPAMLADQISLFLDFDGTLVELAERPDAVVVTPSLTALLMQLEARLAGRVALVSGRSVAQLDQLIGPYAQSLTVVGSHGAEIRMAGKDISSGPRPVALEAAEAAFREAFAGNANVVIEVKTLGVAAHYRLDPSVEPIAKTLAQQLAAESGLYLQGGKMMVELRTDGHDKGSGIAALMASPRFADRRPVFLGDDVTDEPGFARCAELGGYGVLVGADRPTAAAYRLADVAAVHDWLAAI